MEGQTWEIHPKPGVEGYWRVFYMGRPVTTCTNKTKAEESMSWYRDAYFKTKGGIDQ